MVHLNLQSVREFINIMKQNIHSVDTDVEQIKKNCFKLKGSSSRRIAQHLIEHVWIDVKRSSL